MIEKEIIEETYVLDIQATKAILKSIDTAQKVVVCDLYDSSGNLLASDRFYWFLTTAEHDANIPFEITMQDINGLG